MGNTSSMGFFVLTIAFLRNAHIGGDNSSFTARDRVPFRIMKSICAARWETYISREFRRKISASVRTGNGSGRITTDVSLVSVICLHDLTFCLIYRHTLVLISALFNAVLFASLYVSTFSPLALGLFVSRAISSNKIFSDFQSRVHVRRKTPFSPRWFVDLPVYRSNLYFTSYLSTIHLSGSILCFIPLYLPDNIYRIVCPFIAFTSRSRWHDDVQEKFCLWDRKTLDICQAASGELKLEARVHSMETTSTVKDRLENLLHLLIKTSLYGRGVLRTVRSYGIAQVCIMPRCFVRATPVLF